jgi:PAS domain-containing protein
MESFVPRLAEEGALYPLEGGMTETIRALGDFNHVRFITVTGLENIRRTLAGFDMERLNGPVFIEALACEGGCISGPCTAGAGALLNKRLAVEQAAILPETPVTRTPQVAIGARFYPEPVEKSVAESNKIREALLRVGKKTAEDELNCSGCGYNTCREFAAALIAGNAEPTMCVSYMRNLAQKKANALLRSMPSGVVIVDETLHIIECNERFGRMFGQDISDIYDACPGLNRCALSKVLPFTDMFTNVLHSGEEVHYDHYRSNGRLLNITVFSLEPGRVAGAVILDVTRQELRRDQIAQKAREVIRRNLGTVQEIACRLGEHMAETEILLRSIAEGYAADDGCGLTERKPDDGGGRS